jgi:cysteine desulfurase
MSRAATLRDRLEQGVLAAIPDVMVNGAAAPRLATTTNLSFKAMDAQSLVVALDLQGVAASTGSACSSGSVEPSHVLIAMGLSDEWLRGSVRLSVGAGNTLDEVETLVQILPPIVARLRQHGGSRRVTPVSSTARPYHT